ncbi:MAG: TatD family hydrolase [Fusobacteriaceae bacterium]
MERYIKPVDTHCHIDNPQYDDDRDGIIENISENLLFAVNIGYDIASSEASIKLAYENSNIFASVGIHPTDIGDEWTSEIEGKLETMARMEKVVAVGEIGLDYHWMTKPKETQKLWLRKQMEIAKRVGKPVVIHTREATADTVEILKEYPEVSGVLHCYPGSYETAVEVMENYYFGVGGVLTFKNSKKTVEFIEKIPLDRVVLETDSPYLTPEPNRGKRNTPLNVEYVAKKIALIKGITYEEVVEITDRNAVKLYGVTDVFRNR